MNILVIGSGGREHALVWALKRSPDVRRVICAPGNPGIAKIADTLAVKADDIQGLMEIARREQIDLTVVGPEQPLAKGIVDEFQRNGLVIFGPSQRAAALEWSKGFAKAFMARHHIPTAHYATVDARDMAGAHATLQSFAPPIVLKADGLAAGKGVVICDDPGEARTVLDDMLSGASFGEAGRQVVIEEFLRGEEASVFAITDGKDYRLLAPAQDHKRALDGDGGKNTGGMGAYAPAPVVTPEIMRRVEAEVLRPTLAGMASEGYPYEGCLYIGLMLTSEGPRVVEYNCRFGDPETQVILPLFRGDLAGTLLGAATGKLSELASPGWSPEDTATAACVVLAAGGYPDRYETGNPIDGLNALDDREGIAAFHAGTRIAGSEIVTAGGRVLGISAMSESGGLAQTLRLCYEAIAQVHFKDMHYRRDIGHRALSVSSPSRQRTP
jgi:phosphoribosylamine--glycine ligase